MKKIISSSAFLMLSGLAIGQAQAGIIPQQGNKAAKINAAKIELPYSPEVVIKTLEEFVSIKEKTKEEKKATYQLSDHTTLATKNLNTADVHFFLELKSPDNPNETVLYLSLASSIRNWSNNEEAYQFKIKDAIDYLNNFQQAAIETATALQVKFQNESLEKSRARSLALENEAIELNKQLTKTEQLLSRNNSDKHKSQLNDQLYTDQRNIHNNTMAQAKQKVEISRQTLALAQRLAKN